MGKLTDKEKKMIKTVFRLMPEKTEAGLQQAFDVYDELHEKTGEDDPENAISKAVMDYLDNKKENSKTLKGRQL